MSATKKVCITGVSGFLAHHVLKEVQSRGWYSIGVDKRPIPPNHLLPSHFIQADVRDLGFRDLMGVDYVIHLAFVTNIPNSVRHPRETTDENIGMTVHLLELCKEAEVKKFFFPSTASLYSKNETPWKEYFEPFPIEPYSWQKLACEQLCRMYSHVYKVPTVVGRFFQIFGEFQREDTALAAFLKAKAEERPITLTETTAQSSFRSGRRDFIYAGDVARAICILLENEEYKFGEIFNVCCGKTTTMEDVANAVGGEIQWIPKREYEVEIHHGDNNKLKILDWAPTVDVLEWLRVQK